MKRAKIEFSKKMYTGVGIAFAIITAYVGIAQWFNKDLLGYYDRITEIFIWISVLYYGKSGTENFMKIKKSSVIPDDLVEKGNDQSV